MVRIALKASRKSGFENERTVWEISKRSALTEFTFSDKGYLSPSLDCVWFELRFLAPERPIINKRTKIDLKSPSSVMRKGLHIAWTSVDEIQRPKEALHFFLLPSFRSKQYKLTKIFQNGFRQSQDGKIFSHCVIAIQWSAVYCLASQIEWSCAPFPKLGCIALLLELPMLICTQKEMRMVIKELLSTRV